MPQAISYTRFSAIHQGQGSTTDRQVEMIDKWLKAHPEVTQSKFSREDTGKSGYKGEHLNHGLGQILEAIKDGKIKRGDFILVEAVDRIGRLPMFEMFEIIKNIVMAGVTIVTLEDQQTYSEETFNTNPGVIFVLVGKIQQAHEYSKNLSRRLIAANDKKRKKARKGEKIQRFSPFWLSTKGNLIQHKAKIVQESIDLYLSGRGTKRIVEDLSKKYPEMKKKHPSTIKRWFKNKALIGIWETNNELIENVFEPLIDNQTFYRLQRELAKRTKQMSPEQTYQMSGLVICDRCGGRFYFRRKKHNDKFIIYSNCSTYLKRGKSFCENNKTWPYEAFIYIMSWGTPESLSFSIYSSQRNELSEEIEDLRFEKNEINNKIEKIIDALIDLPDQKNLKERLKEMEEKRIQLETRIANLEDAILNRENTHESINDKISEKANETIRKIIVILFL